MREPLDPRGSDIGQAEVFVISQDADSTVTVGPAAHRSVGQVPHVLRNIDLRAIHHRFDGGDAVQVVVLVLGRVAAGIRQFLETVSLGFDKSLFKTQLRFTLGTKRDFLPRETLLFFYKILSRRPGK